MNVFQRPPTQPTKVTLEDLLRLKRAERPPVEFWADFERQMRSKQLAAIVRKDPWWRSWRNVLASSVRLHLPLGATAMVALAAFITVRELRRSTPVETRLPVAAATVPSVRAQPVVVESQASPELASNYSDESHLSSAPVSQPAPLVKDASVEVAQVASSLSVQSSEESGTTPEMIGFSAGPNSSSKSTLSQSSRDIAGNLASAQADEPELLPVLARSRNLQEKSGSVEPLSQVSTPRDARRARLLASAVATDLHSPEHSAARSRERITSQLNDQSLYDSITRLGLAGNRLSIKF
jgi:hypothetical protein